VRGHSSGCGLIHPFFPRLNKVKDMDEILFNEAGVKISSQRLTVERQVYALKDIDSVELKKTAPKRMVALAFLLSGLFFMLDEGKLFALGGFFVLIGIVLLISGTTQYTIVLNSDMGRNEVISSSDSVFIEKVLQVLDSAMLNQAHPKGINLHLKTVKIFNDAKVLLKRSLRSL
jgi:hypothetical protein